MDKDDVEIIEQKINYNGYFSILNFKYRHKRFAGGWSAVIDHEMFSRGNSVGVLLYDPVKQKVALIEQCRTGALTSEQSPWLMEIVAGECEPNETDEQVAIREAKEEANVTVTEMIPITRYFVSPGGTDEAMALFCAKIDSSNTGGIHGLQDEHEDIKVHIMTCEEAFHRVKIGKINTGPAIIALQWLQINKESLWQERHD